MKTTKQQIKSKGFKFTQRLMTFGIVVALLMACSSSDNDPVEPVANLFGNVSGIILDESGNPYQSVEVILDKAGQTEELAFTDPAGTYQMNNVAVGNYNLSISVPLGSDVTNANPRSVSIQDAATTTANYNIRISPNAAFYVLAPKDPMKEVRNADGGVPTGDDLLYTPVNVSDPTGPNNPIVAPDGHHISLTEWVTVTGSATVSCDGGITKYSLEFTNLIPNGVYTIWNAILNKHLEPTQGIDFSEDISGMGALGDGESNIVIASETGEGAIEVSVMPGFMTMFGSHPPCGIANSPGLILVMNYHIDGQTYGDYPGPDSQDVAHMLVYY